MPPSADRVHVLGVRHHGPGSARAVLHYLEALHPDTVLIEGPPDADDVLQLAAHPAFKPPVALLIYAADDPSNAVFYPYATYSPEWVALQWALKNHCKVRFCDRHLRHRLAVKQEDDGAHDRGVNQPSDPLQLMAEAAGFSDGERWWDRLIESRPGNDSSFEALCEMMAEARGSLEIKPSDLEREAAMRQIIRKVITEGAGTLAVICGAFHVPALAGLDAAMRNLYPIPTSAQDNALLAGAPKVAVRATWAPWSYDRLTLWSGYGAGVASPMWYQQVWDNPAEPTSEFASRSGRLLREAGMNAPTSSVVDAVRHAEAMAALRDHPGPGLEEACDAVLCTLCQGDDLKFRLVRERLIVGADLGEVPPIVPTTPLQEHFAREIKRLKLKQDTEVKSIDLDLRLETDRERSRLLHRMRLLNIPWGMRERIHGRPAGTFHEMWAIAWDPEYAVRLVEASLWGNTVDDAAANRVADRARKASSLDPLIALLEDCLLSDLAAAVAVLVDRLEELAVVAADGLQLLRAVPQLAEAVRYGTVHKFDRQSLVSTLDSVILRLCINLPAACAMLDEEAAGEVSTGIFQAHEAIQVVSHDPLCQGKVWTDQWQAALQKTLDGPNTSNGVAGICCRLLFDLESISANQAGLYLHRALSQGANAPESALWLEGFLSGSGLILLHHDSLWRLVDDWLQSLENDQFLGALPLVRRTTATFSSVERSDLLVRAKAGKLTVETAEEEMDWVRALPAFETIQIIHQART